MSKLFIEKDLAVLRGNAERCENMLKLLANQRRLMILCQLVSGPKNVSQLLEYTDISQSALSQHLAKMRRQGLIRDQRQGQHILYRLNSPEAEAILTTLYLLYCKT